MKHPFRLDTGNYGIHLRRIDEFRGMEAEIGAYVVNAPCGEAGPHNQMDLMAIPQQAPDEIGTNKARSPCDQTTCHAFAIR